ncbi:HPr kinase/phosphorylase [Elysia marginata]|uniref:HPr kinase/phosphorylase n=1 Tax=Elysia marginata TaxID=1093978 RepID=A0AAV4IUN9_9GAST|nr:HPr kinase/phosphorylase [Elysia marginata]
MKDVCTTPAMQLKQENHRKEINANRMLRDDTKNDTETDKTIAAAAFDLEEVLPLPKINEGDMSYSRQSDNYTLSVYGYHDKTGHNYLWNETTAKRGSN